MTGDQQYRTTQADDGDFVIYHHQSGEQWTQAWVRSDITLDLEACR